MRTAVLGISLWSWAIALLSAVAASLTLYNGGLTTATTSGRIRIAIAIISLSTVILSLHVGCITSQRIARLESGRHARLSANERAFIIEQLSAGTAPEVWIHGEGGDDIRDLANDLYEALGEARWNVTTPRLGGALFGSGQGIIIGYGIDAAAPAEELHHVLQSIRDDVTIGPEDTLPKNVVNIAIPRP